MERKETQCVRQESDNDGKQINIFPSWPAKKIEDGVA